MNHEEGYEYNETEIVTDLVPVGNAEAVVNVNRVPQLIAPDQLPDLDAMEQGFSLQAKYIEFEQVGTCERGVFLGFTQMINQQGVSIDVANFQNKQGVWVNAGANLVSQLRNVPEGTPLAVTYNGKEDTKRGNKVKVFDVRILNAHKNGSSAPEPKRTATDFWTLANEMKMKKEASEIVNRNTSITEVGNTTDWNAAYKELQALVPHPA